MDALNLIFKNINMEEILPLFKSHYSIGRSILNLEEADEIRDDYPVSIISICKEYGLEEMYLVDDCMSGFLQAYINSSNNKIKLNFGIRILLCNDITVKNEEARKQTSKIILFAKNGKGFSKLIKIYSKAATEGKYYAPRVDSNLLKEFWNPKDLMLCVPFYDSYLELNAFHQGLSLPNLDDFEPTYFWEDNDLPFDTPLKDNVMSYSRISGEAVQQVQSIYYYKRDDFKAYLTFRCIANRSDLSTPRLSHMGSEEFCFENWLSKKGEKIK